MANQNLAPGASEEIDSERWRSYLDYQLDKEKQASAARRWPRPGPAVTISGQTGSGARELAKQLTSVLQGAEPKGAPPWTIFDRQLVERMLEEHHLPRHLAKFMPEDGRSYLDDVLDEMVGLRPPSWELIPKLIQSVLHLADAGYVILVGRGAAFITGQLPKVFHVRLIASLPKRIERVQKLEKLSEREAARLIAKTDRGRDRFLRAYFHAHVDDESLYDIVVNTDRVPLPKAAELIAAGAERCFEGYGAD